MATGDTEWHLDKKVPIGLIAIIVIQTTGIVWWASTINYQVRVFETYISNNNAENLRQWDRINSNESNVSDVRAIMLRNNAILDRVEKRVDSIHDKFDDIRQDTLRNERNFIPE